MSGDSANMVRILLVEDNPGDARLVLESLKAVPSAQYEVVHAVELSEAAMQLARASFDVMLLDLSLPDSAGVQTVKRANALAPDLPIVVLTGADDAVAMDALHEGAQDYISKRQIEGRLIHRVICYAMEHRRNQIQLQRAHDELERRVKDRTAELENTLTALQEEFGDRIKAQTALEESESRFRRMAEAIQEVLWLGSPDMEIVYYINPTFEKLWRRPAQEVLRRPYAWADGIHPDDRDRVVRHVKRWVVRAAANQSDADEGYYRVLRPDGSVITVHSRRYAIRDRQGRLVQTCGLIQDVTTQADEVDHHRLLAACVESSSAAIMLVDSNGRILATNAAACSIFQTECAELAGVSFEKLLSPTQADGSILQDLRQQRGFRHRELSIQPQGGEAREVKATAWRATDSQGRVAGMCVMLLEAAPKP